MLALPTTTARRPTGVPIPSVHRSAEVSVRSVISLVSHTRPRAHRLLDVASKIARAIPLAAPHRSRKRNRPLGRLIGRDSALQNSSVNGRSDQEPGQKTDSVLMKQSRKKNVFAPQMRPMSLLRPLYIRARDIGTFNAPKWPKGHSRDTGTLATIIRDITNGPSVINDAARRAKTTVREPARQGHSPMSFYGFRILPLSDPPFTRHS